MPKANAHLNRNLDSFEKTLVNIFAIENDKNNYRKVAELNQLLAAYQNNKKNILNPSSPSLTSIANNIHSGLNLPYLQESIEQILKTEDRGMMLWLTNVLTNTSKALSNPNDQKSLTNLNKVIHARPNEKMYKRSLTKYDVLLVAFLGLITAGSLFLPFGPLGAGLLIMLAIGLNTERNLSRESDIRTTQSKNCKQRNRIVGQVQGDYNRSLDDKTPSHPHQLERVQTKKPKTQPSSNSQPRVPLPGRTRP